GSRDASSQLQRQLRAAGQSIHQSGNLFQEFFLIKILSLKISHRKSRAKLQLRDRYAVFLSQLPDEAVHIIQLLLKPSDRLFLSSGKILDSPHCKAASGQVPAQDPADYLLIHSEL